MDSFDKGGLKQTGILVVDDDAPQRLLLRLYLEKENFKVFEAENGEDALKLLEENPRLRMVITDLFMPKMDGFELIRAIRSNDSRYIYTLVLTSSDDSDSIIQALTLGADDYITKPVSPREMILRMNGGLRLLLLEVHEELIFSMAKLADYHSKETGYHLERVKAYTHLLALYLVRNHDEIGLSIRMAEEIANVSPLHDLGKVAIPDSILHKPGKLTPEEFEIIKTHTTIGGNILKEIYEKTHSRYLQCAYEITMHHHERYDGSGYPQGLSGRAIPLSARIVALSDVYDAIRNKRSYKDAAPHEEVREYIIQQRGRHFDPLIVDAFLALEEEWQAIGQRYTDGNGHAAPENQLSLSGSG